MHDTLHCTSDMPDDAGDCGAHAIELSEQLARLVAPDRTDSVDAVARLAALKERCTLDSNGGWCLLTPLEGLFTRFLG